MFVGVIRGLQMMAEFVKTFFTFAISHPEAMGDWKAVADQWLRETVNEVGTVKVSAWSLMMNGDPWRKSREMWRACKLKWGV